MNENRQLSHVNRDGEAHMVDVTDKVVTHRVATAEAKVKMQPDTLAMISSGDHAKGDVLAVARIAGIQGAKKCSELIPLCHPLALTSVEVKFEIDRAGSTIVVTATCKLDGKTGVEMEALTAVSVASLTIYDMCKAVDKGIIIDGIRLIAKSGGKSGDWRAGDTP